MVTDPSIGPYPAASAHFTFPYAVSLKCILIFFLQLGLFL